VSCSITRAEEPSDASNETPVPDKEKTMATENPGGKRGNAIEHVDTKLADYTPITATPRNRLQRSCS